MRHVAAEGLRRRVWRDEDGLEDNKRTRRTTVNPIDALKHKWQEWTGEEETPLDGDTPAWIISVAVHLAVLVTLAVIFQQQKE